MKRGGPIARKVQLSRRGALLRQSQRTVAVRKPVKRDPAEAKVRSGPPEVKLRGPRRWHPRMDKGLRDAVMARAGNRCDICGDALSAKSWECHHRRLRSQGGTDDPTNLLALDHSCHDRAHRSRIWARECGYIVHNGDDPATRPVWRHGRSWQIPTCDGWTACEPPAGVDLTLTERTAA